MFFGTISFVYSILIDSTSRDIPWLTLEIFMQFRLYQLILCGYILFSVIYCIIIIFFQTETIAFGKTSDWVFIKSVGFILSTVFGVCQFLMDYWLIQQTETGYVSWPFNRIIQLSIGVFITSFIFVQNTASYKPLQISFALIAGIASLVLVSAISRSHKAIERQNFNTIINDELLSHQGYVMSNV